MFGHVFKFSRSPRPARPEPTATPAGPYRSAAVNDSYHALFCDDARLFSPRPGERFMPWHALLGNRAASPAAVRGLALDPRTSPTVRALAWHWLRQHSHGVPRAQLNGLVVETGHADGLDTLAVYADGSVRHIEPNGTPAGLNTHDIHLQFAAVRAVALAQSMLRTLPSPSRRRADVPSAGSVRLSFVASDGLYVDEGPLSLMVHEPMAGRVLRQVDDLRQLALAAWRQHQPPKLVDMVMPRAA
jgi:hypothetical protein